MGVEISKNNSAKTILEGKDLIVDSDWLSNAFLVKDSDLSKTDNYNRYWSTADMKFTDNSLGGHLAINPPFAFTSYADIRRKGRRLDRNDVTVTSRTGNYGMGRYVSEAIDDPSMLIFMEFGVAQHSNILDFMSRSVDYPASVIANTGRSPIAYDIGKIVGSVATFVAYPHISALVYATKFVRGLVSNDEPFSYYKLKPTMHTFWNGVNIVANTFAVESGMMIPEFINDPKKAQHIGVPIKISQDSMDSLKSYFPEAVTKNNYIDVFALINRPQAMANKQAIEEMKLFEEGKLSKIDMDKLYTGYVRTAITDPLLTQKGSSFGEMLNNMFMFQKKPEREMYDPKIVTYEDYLKEMYDGNTAYGNETEEDKIARQARVEELKKAQNETVADKKASTYNEDGTVKKSFFESIEDSFDGIMQNMDASVRGGGNYAVLRVEHVGTVTESFSNSVTEIPAKGVLKSISSKSKSVKFSLSGGNIAGDTVNSMLGYAKDFAVGTLNGLSFGMSDMIPTLLGGGYIDMPKMWEDSIYNAPKLSFKMPLRSPYGHPIARYKNIYLPMSILLNAALPKSIGEAGYTSPYLFNYFIKGFSRSRLAIMSNLAFNRGVGNLGFDRQGATLAVDVTFDFVDLTTIMTAPIEGGMFGGFRMAFNDGSVLNNYISTIAARDLLVTKLSMPKAKIKLSKVIHAKDSLLSEARWGMAAGHTLSGVLGGVTSSTSLNMLLNNDL